VGDEAVERGTVAPGSGGSEYAVVCDSGGAEAGQGVERGRSCIGEDEGGQFWG
jgi:hypothetical protein